MISIVQQTLIAAVVGLLSGTHAAIWGMYKDAVHEGFALSRFARSVIVGCVCAIVLQRAFRLPMNSAASLVLLFGLAYASERGLVEVWKTFIRDEDQSKYFIPMQFSFRGRPVKDRRIRLAAGGVYVAVVAISLLIIARLDRGGDANPLRSALVGLATGLIVAIGGCWKDAPTEGFDPIKFTRSPWMTVVYATLLSLFTDSYLLIAIGSIGYERATAETYKKFFFPSRPPGKFAGKPVAFPHMFKVRRWFVPLYVAIWLLVAVSGALALRDRVGHVAVTAF